MQVKLLLVTFYLNGRLHAVSVGKPSERMSNFWTVRFIKNRIRTEFRFFAHPYIKCVTVSDRYHVRLCRPIIEFSLDKCSPSARAVYSPSKNERHGYIWVLSDTFYFFLHKIITKIRKIMTTTATSNQLDVRPSRLVTVGDRSFGSVGPKLNSLPDDITSASSLSVFRKKLKTHLFQQSYPDIIL